MRRLQEPLVLVLAVDLQEVIADPLQQGERDRRIVDEGPVTARARELASDEELTGLERDAGLVERDQSGAPRRWLEHGLDRGRLRLRPDQVGVRPNAAKEENRVDHDRFPGS